MSIEQISGFEDYPEEIKGDRTSFWVMLGSIPRQL